MEKKIPFEKKKKKESTNSLFQWIRDGLTHFSMGLKVPTHTGIFY